jgi:hypothetical protein
VAAPTRGRTSLAGFSGPFRNHPGMALLAFTIARHTGVRLAELAGLLGAVGGLALLVGGMTPFGKRVGQTIGGLALALGFGLLTVAIHFGHFGHLH